MKLQSGLSFDRVPELQSLWAELSEMRLVLGGLPVLVSAVDREGLISDSSAQSDCSSGT